jgi:hypothetical protein
MHVWQKLKPSSRVSTLASKVLSGETTATAKDAKTLAASVLTQSPDKKNKQGRRCRTVRTRPNPKTPPLP